MVVIGWAAALALGAHPPPSIGSRPGKWGSGFRAIALFPPPSVASRLLPTPVTSDRKTQNLIQTFTWFRTVTLTRDSLGVREPVDGGAHPPPSIGSRPGKWGSGFRAIALFPPPSVASRLLPTPVTSDRKTQKNELLQVAIGTHLPTSITFNNIEWESSKRHEDVVFEYKRDVLNMRAAGVHMQDLLKSGEDAFRLEMLRDLDNVVYASREVEIRIMWPGYKPFCHPLPCRGERLSGKWRVTRQDFAIGVRTALDDFLKFHEKSSEYVIDALHVRGVVIDKFHLDCACKDLHHIQEQYISVLGCYHTGRKNWQIKIFISDNGLA
ncbi:hypothetical protein BJ165DRAFT_1523281 [Panaeolus papilionaceus]|nr:hypothetical protein BJ165DRAFT_1523281 [Panaeolus papilionaceus]